MAGSKPGHGRSVVSAKKVPPFDGTLVLSLSLVQFRSELASALPLLIGVLALTIRILLLLSGLLALTIRILLLLSGLLATALLLTGLLARVLVLLARILVLVSHRDLPG